LKLLKFLPSYVGSKSHWVPSLLEFKGQPFVELFCGSAVLSANLAKTAVLNDIDPFVCKILRGFCGLTVPEVFTAADYAEKRKGDEWWKYAYCLQKMSFSGVFRYSKTGYNVPPKNILEIRIRKDYERAVARYQELQPTIAEGSYLDFPFADLKDKVVVLDPPYEGSKANYNTKFDYRRYWDFVLCLEGWARAIILFDSVRNMPFRGVTREMVVNGKYDGDTERMCILTGLPRGALEDGKPFVRGGAGADIFAEIAAKQEDGLFLVNGKKTRLQCDYYDADKTDRLLLDAEVLDWEGQVCYFFPKNKRGLVFDACSLSGLGTEATSFDGRRTLSVPKESVISIPGVAWQTSEGLSDAKGAKDA
jgi:site-specific DNA-adenine methylase